jgi:nucleoside-diphosphate-sugar epimerase
MTRPRVALVTGATGFVGGHLTRRLLADGWTVHALARPPLTRVPAGADAVEVPGTTGALVDAVAAIAPDVCFHLATRFQPRHDVDDVAPLVDANVTFGAQLAEALARTTRTPLVNVGTAWQHYEGRPSSPTSLYAATKQALAEILEYYRQVEELPVATLELFDTYGPGDTRPKLVNLLLDAAQSGTTLEMSPGEQLIDLLHVDDAVDALCAVAVPLVDGAAAGGTFAARSGAPLSLRELVALVGDVTGSDVSVRWGARPYRPREMMEPWPAPPPPPGWAPRVALRDGLRALVDADA